MPGIHSPLSRHFITIDGAVKTTGGAKQLAQGQFAIVQKDKPTAEGAAVLGGNLLQALSPNAQLEMRLGKFQFANPTNVYNNTPHSSETFKLGSIARIKTYSPKVTEQEFDSWIIGYDGINASSALTIPEGGYSVVDIHFSGDAVEFVTGNKMHLAKFHIQREEGQSMQEVIRELYKNITNYTLQGNIPLTSLASVKLVDSTATALTGTQYVFATLTIDDQGEAADLARIQAQYPYKVIRKERYGLTSVYSVVRPSGVSLANYVKNFGSYLKGCETCPAGYTAIPGGLIYSVALEDDGGTSVSLVQGLPATVANSAVKVGNDGGKGLYTVVTTRQLTVAEIETFVAAGTVQKTAEIQYVGKVADLCDNTATTSTAWVNGTSCYASTQNYQLQLQNDDCNGSRLSELQLAYPGLTIVVADSTNSSVDISLSGTSGTANVNVKGVNYLATFASSLTTTANNFVTTHATALATAGVTVTASAGVLKFVGLTADIPGITITNVTTNLAGTIGSPTVLPLQGGCQKVYQTSVVTDIICEDCDPIFTELFKSKAPQAFEGIEWKLISTPTVGAGLMGIKITGKPIIQKPTDIVKDMIPYYETSARIMVAGGYAEDVNRSILYNIEPFAIKQLGWAVDRDNLGWHLLPWEEASRTYFEGTSRHKNNMYARTVLGEESVLKFDSQYVGYEITIMDRKFSQGVGHTSNIGTSYTIWAEVGFHTALQNLVNQLASKVGIPVEKAFTV